MSRRKTSRGIATFWPAYPVLTLAGWFWNTTPLAGSHSCARGECSYYDLCRLAVLDGDFVACEAILDWELGDYITIAEAAEILQRTPKTIRNLIRNGRIEVIRAGRTCLVSAADVQRLAEEAVGES